jgi:hypothetical protein
MENNNKKMNIEDFLMLWGFIFFIFGAIGTIQIGFLDGINIFILYGSLLMIIGIIILSYIAVADKKKM